MDLARNIHAGIIILSVRSAAADAQAGEMLRQVVGKLGRAGGIIQLLSTAARAVEQMQGELCRRLLKALHIDECRGQRLVSRKEMLQNLHG